MRDATVRSVISAEEVRAQCVSGAGGGADKVVRLSGLHVTGLLDLHDIRLEVPVSFTDCEFDDVIDLTDARAERVIRLEGCTLPGVLADRLRTMDDLAICGSRLTGQRDGRKAATLSLAQVQLAGNLRCTGTRIDAAGDLAAVDGMSMRVAGSALFDRGFSAYGEIRLTSAHIEGDLNLNDSCCHNPGHRSIDASWLVVGGEMLCQEGFRAEGEVFLQWAQLRALRATGATFINAGGNAITADGARVATGIFLDKGMCAQGQISLIETKLDGELNCTRSRLEAPGGRALDATRFETREVYLNDGFVAKGEVRFGGARISGQLNCTGGHFHNTEGCALDLGGLSCDGDVFLGGGFHAAGQVRLTRATIRRELNCGHGSFSAPRSRTDRDGAPPDLGRTSRAIDAEGLTIDGSVYLNDRFRSVGEVFLFRSNIGQQLDCAGGRIVNPGGTALELSGARVHGDVRLIRGFSAVGAVKLSRASVGQHLDCEAGHFEVGRGHVVMDANGLKVAGSFIWLPAAAPPAGHMDLSFASTGRLTDAPGVWPRNGQVELSGFEYGSLESAVALKDSVDLRERLDWLDEAATYSLQAYQQLATVYRQVGRDKDARRVALEKHRRRRKKLPFWLRGWSWFQDVTVGYGYRLYNALFIVVALGVIGTILFRYAQTHDLMLSTAATPPGSIRADHCTRDYPCFTPYIYSLQLLLPVVNLNQTNFWLPNSFSGWGELLLAYTWLTIIFGWLLGVALVAGLGRVFGRD